MDLINILEKTVSPGNFCIQKYNFYKSYKPTPCCVNPLIRLSKRLGDKILVSLEKIRHE